MPKLKSEFLNIVSERGFIYQCSDLDALDQLMSKQSIPGYIGFDCTADSLHVGSLVQIMWLYWMQQTGHKPIALMGSGTTRIGDPSERTETRKMMTGEEIEANKKGIQRCFESYLKFGDGPSDALMEDNAKWLLELNYVDFLRDYGQHFSVNRMLSFDSVRLRIEREQSLSFLEFNYMIMQAYDYLELNRRHGCRLQLGGSDQWGNIINGVELGRRVDRVELFALCSPLITSASGAKMGKTLAGAVWLSEDKLPVFDFWQYWRNVEDADVGRFSRLFTTMPLSEISRLEALKGQEINEAKKILATEVTAMLYGREKAEAAAATATTTFEQGHISQDLPAVEVKLSELKAGLGILNAFVLAGLVSSTSEARRQIRGGGVKVNDENISNEKALLQESHLVNGEMIKLSLGRKRHVLLRFI